MSECKVVDVSGLKLGDTRIRFKSVNTRGSHLIELNYLSSLYLFQCLKKHFKIIKINPDKEWGKVKDKY